MKSETSRKTVNVTAAVPVLFLAAPDTGGGRKIMQLQSGARAQLPGKSNLLAKCQDAHSSVTRRAGVCVSHKHLPRGWIGARTECWALSPRVSFFLKIIFIYLTERESACRSTQQGELQAEGGEAVFPLSGEPDAELNPRTLGS